MLFPTEKHGNRTPYGGALLCRTPRGLILWYWLVLQHANIIKYVGFVGKKVPTTEQTEAQKTNPVSWEAVVPSEARGLDHFVEVSNLINVSSVTNKVQGWQFFVLLLGVDEGLPKVPCASSSFGVYRTHFSWCPTMASSQDWIRPPCAPDFSPSQKGVFRLVPFFLELSVPFLLTWRMVFCT